MSETTNENAAPEGTAPEGAEETQQLGDAGKKALDAMKGERNAARDEARQLKAKLDEIERANMSELERAAADAKSAKDELEALRGGLPKQVADSLRPYLTRLHGIGDDDAALYLTSDDPEILLKQAMGLASRSASPTTPPGPRPDLTQGGTGAPPALNSDALEKALRDKLGA